MYTADEAPNDLTPIPDFTELDHNDKKLKQGQGGRHTGY
jgi:hypothetical protein